MTNLARVLAMTVALAAAAPIAWADEPAGEDIPVVQGKSRPSRDDWRRDVYRGDHDPGRNDGRDDRGWDHGPPATAELRCASRDGRAQECRLPFPGRVMLARQDSRSACVRGHSWDVYRGSLWVYNGCRGHFLVESRGRSRY